MQLLTPLKKLLGDAFLTSALLCVIIMWAVLYKVCDFVIYGKNIRIVSGKENAEVIGLRQNGFNLWVRFYVFKSKTFRKNWTDPQCS